MAARSRLPGGRRIPLLFGVVLVALALRLFGLNWDDGHTFHPDERFILMTADQLALPQPFSLGALLQVSSPLNPHSFAYGSLPFYLLWAISTSLGWLGGAVDGLASLARFGGYEGMRYVGRITSAFFDVGTVVLVYVLGRRLYGRGVGLLAAAFVAVSVLDVQLSHFYASDTLLTCFLMATLLCLVGVVRERGRSWPLLAGIFVGLALVSKVSAAPILAAVGVAYGLRVFTVEADGQDGRLGLRANWLPELGPALSDLTLTLAAMAVTFVVLEPYALIDISTFLKNVNEQNAMAQGRADLPYTRQFADRLPYLYFLDNLAVFGLGLPLGIAAILGWLYVMARSLRAPRLGDVLLLAWIVPYFLITGSFHAKFLRYMLPIAPLLCLFGAEALLRFRGWARSLSLAGSASSLLRAAPSALVALVLGLTALNAVAFDAIYTRPHTAVTASRWIYQNVPKGSTIAIEHWEEGMPLSVSSGDQVLSPGSQNYKVLTLNLYEDDNEAKLNQVVQQLQSTDYVVFFSNRLYGTIPRLPDRYPMTSEYYRLLFGEQLGFRLVGAFTSYPSFLGVTLEDDTLADPGLPTPALLASLPASPIVIDLGHADESFSVYDHPKVLVFQNTERLSATTLRGLLRPALVGGATPAQEPPAAPTKPLLLTTEARLLDEAGGTFRDLFSPSGLANQWPLPVWALLVEVIGLAGAPLAFAVCRSLADRGYLLGKTLGVLLFSWLAWIVVSVGLLPNGQLSVFLALAVLLAIGAALAYGQRRAIAAFLRERWRLVVVGEAVFWAAFLLFVAIRLSNPDLWHPARGGEKPMDIAFLMASIKSATFPPYDPWFAGGYLNYYYYGQSLVASLVKISGIVPTTAYNLVVPLLFALTLGGAFTVAYNLVGEGFGRRRAVVGGLAGAAFVGLLGNLGGGLQLVGQIAGLAKLDYRGPVPGLSEVARFVYGLGLVVFGHPLQIPTDWYWASTRVIPGTINEFPFFTFLYADLHAHMIALPLTLLALGLALNVAKERPDEWGEDDGAGAALGRWLLGLFVLALAVGALLPTNSWDYPTYLVIVGCSLFLPSYLSGKSGRGILLALVTRAAAIGLLSYVLFLPFHEGFQSFYSGVKPNAERSPIGDYLVIHGFLLAALGAFLARDFFSRMGRNGTLRGIGQGLRWWDRLPRLLHLRRSLVEAGDEAGAAGLIAALTLLAVAVVLAALGMALVGFLLLVLAPVVFLAMRRDRPVEELYILLLFAAGLGLGIVTELVAIDGDVGRMNTVFKFYLQVWVLWGVAAAAALARSWDWLRARRSFGRKRGRKRLWLGLLVGLFLLCAVYPIVGTEARVRDRFDNSIPPTLDGTAYMQSADYYDQNQELSLASDLEAIRWLQANVVGSPVILEGQAPIYRWGSRVSIYTGLPTVIGWDWHETQQRWGYQEQVQDRGRDVVAMYSDASIPSTLDLLKRYHVSYVYVGGLERAYYPAAGLAKFDRMVGQYLSLVYDRNGVKIYQVVGENG